MRRFMVRVLPPRPLMLPAVASGLLLTLAFPPLSLDWLAFVALVPLLVGLLRERPDRGAAWRAGFLAGATCYVTMLWWIVKLIPTAGVTIPWLMTPALILLVMYLALYTAVFSLVVSSLRGQRAWVPLVAAPAVWVLLEAVRSRGELAFPWGALGYALSDTLPLLQIAAVGGLPVLSFLAAGVGALLAGVFVARDARDRMVCALVAVGIVGVWWIGGQRDLKRWSDEDARRVRVSIVQPNVDLAVKWLPEYRESTLTLIEEMTRESARAGADLIVFPETTAPVYIDDARPMSQRYRATLQMLAETLRIPIYIGFLDFRYDGPDKALNVYNSSGVFRPDGLLLKYDKNHLLPFGEALPGSRRARWLRRIDFGQANFEPGRATPPIATGTTAITPLVCFEAVFPYLCARGVRDGSELFVNITNDGWFADTPGPFQHAQMCILRAVEFRRYLVRSANSGVSMVVAPTGEITHSLGLFKRGVITADVAALKVDTFYARHGDAPVLILSAVMLLGCIIARRVLR